MNDKFEKLQGLLIHSLKVMEKMAMSMDNLPEALQQIQRHAGQRKKPIKQEYHFEGMIKELLDHSKDFRLRRSDIGLSSFGSYFKKVIKEVNTKDHVPTIDGVKKMNLSPQRTEHDEDGQSMLMEPEESLMNHPLKPKSSMSGFNTTGRDSKRSKSNLTKRAGLKAPRDEEPQADDPKNKSHYTTFDPNVTGMSLPPIFGPKVDVLMENQQLKA